MKHVLSIGLLAFAIAACSDDKKDGPDDTDNTSLVSATGRVTSANDGDGIADVKVTSGSVSTTTDANGSYTLEGIRAASSVMLSFTKTGYVPQSRSTLALKDASDSTIINVPMLAVRVTESFDSSAAHDVVVPGSTARVSLAAGSLRRADGGAVVGQATAFVTPIAPASNIGVMPGNYLAASGDGTAAMESFGALDASFVDESGAALNLASGTTSTLRIEPSTRASTLPPTIPLFYFDTTSGLWKQEGEATLVGSGPDAYYEGTVAHFTTWNADRIYDTSQILGCVEDANGNRVANAIVYSEGKTYTGQGSALTDANGQFSVPAMQNGEAFVVAATADGTQVSNARPVFVSVIDSDLGLPCLQLTQAALSIKLTWGPSPSDLDSHTLGANLDAHIYFGNRGELGAAPFVALDVDDTSGFGPEVTSFAKLAKNRTYRYFVTNYSDSYDPGQTGSPARVDVTLNGTQTVFTPPSGENTSTRFWHVFDLTTNANCEATIVPAQVFLADEPVSPNADNAAEYCN